MGCAYCANHDLVTIELTIASEHVVLHRCPRCDARMWSGTGGELTREGVLELVRSNR